jgi:hypothetical protein
MSLSYVKNKLKELNELPTFCTDNMTAATLQDRLKALFCTGKTNSFEQLKTNSGENVKDLLLNAAKALFLLKNADENSLPIAAAINWAATNDEELVAGFQNSNGTAPSTSPNRSYLQLLVYARVIADGANVGNIKGTLDTAAKANVSNTNFQDTVVGKALEALASDSLDTVVLAGGARRTTKIRYQNRRYNVREVEGCKARCIRVRGKEVKLSEIRGQYEYL